MFNLKLFQQFNDQYPACGLELRLQAGYRTWVACVITDMTHLNPDAHISLPRRRKLTSFINIE